MEKSCLEVVVISDEDDICQKRQAPDLEQEPVYKKPRRESPVYPVEWESSIPPIKRVFFASNLVLPTVQLQSVQRYKKPPCRKVPYNPYDFTSDELDPAYEWPRESSPRRSCKKYRSVQMLSSPRRNLGGTYGVTDAILLLQHTLGQFPLGLRLDKLEAMMWKEHKIKLANLSLERGYWDILKFLESVPGIRLTLRKGTARCLVQLEDQTGDKASH